MSKDRYAVRKSVLGLAWWLCPLLVWAQEPVPAPRPMPSAPAPAGQSPGPAPPAAMPPRQLPPPRPVPPAPVSGTPSPTPAPLNPTILGSSLPAKPSPKVDPQDLLRLLNRLKAEREALNAERTAAAQVLSDDDSTAEQIAQLRLRLGQYLSRLGVRRFPEKMRAAVPPGSPLPSSPRPAGASEGAGKPEKAPAAPSRPPVDAVALGRTLFRARDYEGALRAFRQANLTGLKPGERRPIEYLIATCLKHLGKLDEAAVIYREVANSKGDEILADCAQWQLSALRWQADLARQIQELRQHLQTLESQP